MDRCLSSCNNSSEEDVDDTLFCVDKGKHTKNKGQSLIQLCIQNEIINIHLHLYSHFHNYRRNVL